MQNTELFCQLLLLKEEAHPDTILLLKIFLIVYQDHAAEARDWDVQRRAYKQQVEGLETQRQKLVEKCHALQVGFSFLAVFLKVHVHARTVHK